MPEHILLMNPRRPRRGVVPPQLRPYLFKKKGHGGRRRKGRTYTVKPHRVTEHRTNRRPHKVRAHYVRSYRSNRRHRHNPISLKGLVGGVPGELVAALIGAVGAIGIEWGWSKVATKLPATFQTGWGAVAAEAGLALVAGYGLGKALPSQKRMINAGVVGSLVVIGYSALKPIVAAKLGLSGLHDYRLYGMNAYIPGRPALPAPPGVGRLSAYIPGNPIQNPAAALRGVMGPGVGGVAPSY